MSSGVEAGEAPMGRDKSTGYFEFVSPDEIRLKGHRVWLEHIVARARQGMNAAEIVADLPTLTLTEAQAALTYIEAHRDEVDAYMARHEAYLAERGASGDPESPVLARLRRLRESLKAQGAQEARSSLSTDA